VATPYRTGRRDSGRPTVNQLFVPLAVNRTP
jgi:hypothetical protein